jgi:N4-gp56 family major capsid protein
MQDSDMNANTTGGESGGSGSGTGPYANTVADISFTTYNPLTSVTATILAHGFGFALRRFDMHRNVLNLLNEAREDLAYAMGTRIDQTMAKKFGTSDGLSFAVSGTRGATQLYGGDATADSGLATGDVITTDLIADASKYLKGTENWYRDGGSGLSGTLTLDTTTSKNPWKPTASEPFVLFIGVQQEATLRKDSQFVNAAEYGDNTVVQNGEIGKYLDTRIIVTTHVESFALSATGPDNTTVAAGLAGGMTRCVLMKAGHAAALVWGMRPELRVQEWAISDQMLVIIWAYYDIVVLQSDAVVCIDVSNN